MSIHYVNPSTVAHGATLQGQLREDMEDLLKSKTFIQSKGETLGTGLRHPAEGAGKRCSECDHRVDYLKQTHGRTQCVCVCVCVLCVCVCVCVCVWACIPVNEYKFIHKKKINAKRSMLTARYYQNKSWRSLYLALTWLSARNTSLWACNIDQPINRIEPCYQSFVWRHEPGRYSGRSQLEPQRNVGLYTVSRLLSGAQKNHRLMKTFIQGWYSYK